MTFLNKRELVSVTLTEENAFNYAKNVRLVKVDQQICQKNDCGCVMKLDKGKKRHGVFSRLKCNKKSCNNTISIFKNTIFDNSHIKISTFFDILYSYSEMKTIKEMMFECSISSETAVAWKKKLENIIIKQGNCLLLNKIGGSSHIVEVDEMHLYTRKYNRGRVLVSESFWAVGVICRTTKQCRFAITTTRTREFLNNFILSNVNVGSIVMSDGWAGYNGLSNLGFTHHVVIHEREFVSRDDNNVHTNNIERLWRSLREFLPKNITFDNIIKKVKLFQIFKEFESFSVMERFDCIINFIKQYYE